MANKSIFDAFERMWQHTVAKLGLKADKAEIQETYETKAAAGDKLAEAKIYTDEAAAAVKDDLLNGAGAAYDTLKELGDLIDENQDALEALETVATGKAEKEHIHAISDVVDLQAKLDSIPELVNSDWNQNDENAADYIKNRPFYETTEVEIEYIPETTLSNFEEEYWSSSNPDTIYYNSRTTTDYYVEFSSDKTYTVIWDGVRYDNVTCESTMGGPMIGSTERQIAGVYGESNQYPFGILMQYIDNSPELYIIAEEEGAHTVKVTSISESYIKTIDFKFLPELVGKYTDTVGHSEIFNDYENNIADGYHSHAEGSNTTAYDCSHAEGCLTVASGEISHAEGY